MEQKKVRIVDIAEEIGVSTATVSNVIHGKTKKISKETVKRVQELLEKRQYIPSMAGILLAQNNSKIIGVVVNKHAKYENHVFEDAFIASSINHLSEEIEQAGYFIMLKTTEDWREITRFASMWNMIGIVLIGFCSQDYRLLRDNMHIPFIIYDGYAEEEKMCNITVDNYDGGYQVGHYFYERGHKKALCIADNDMCMDEERFLGFQAGMGDRTTDRLIVPMQKEERIRYYHQKLQDMMQYSAIFAVSDYYAIELMQFLQEQGIRIPDDISVAGFDDSYYSELFFPTLTTVKQNIEERARLAVDMLQKLQRDEEVELKRKLPVQLVIRNSTR